MESALLFASEKQEGKMTNASDFAIENGVLKSYTGSSGDVMIPDEMKSIGNQAFFGCHNLKNVTIPESVTGIGNFAFSKCGALTRLAIPQKRHIYRQVCISGAQATHPRTGRFLCRTVRERK